MRQLFPTPVDEIDTARLIAADARPARMTRPWVLVNMIASVDGATAVDARSGGLGGPADKEVFRALRAVPDVILVGAATVRTEGYGPVRLDDVSVARRRARGQTDTPRLAIVSGSLDLDPDAAMFTESTRAPIVFTTTGADDARLEALRAVAEVVTLGETLDLGAVLAHLRTEGATVVLCEGGPRVNAQLIDADLVDEWCQTIAPILVAGGSSRAAHSPTHGDGPRTGTDIGTELGETPARLRLDRVLEQDGMLLARYVRAS